MLGQSPVHWYSMGLSVVCWFDGFDIKSIKRALMAYNIKQRSLHQFYPDQGPRHMAAHH